MSTLRIRGGRPLCGEVSIGGSKNGTLALLSAVVMAKGPVVLHNTPYISDVLHKLKLLEKMGVMHRWEGSSLYLDATYAFCPEEKEVGTAPIRTSFYLLGPLAARIGRAVIPTPGGCDIGTRPVDYHLKGLAQLGIQVTLRNGVYVAEVDQLKGTEIYLDFPSAGATQHLMTTATLAEGSTVIHNAALEPEVTTLADLLNRMGARIEGAGTKTITILGVSELKGAEFQIPADRIQAATYLMAGAITQGDVTVRNILPEHMLAVANKLGEAGATITEGHDWMRIQSNGSLNAIRIKAMPHPGFPTDVQQPMVALLSLAKGTSILVETVYDGRIGHIPELNRMGAKIDLEGNTSIIEGVESLHGSVVTASDLRAGAALCLAGLATKEETFVRHAHLVDRGYECFEERLCLLGADVLRISEEGRSASEIIASGVL